MLPLLAYAYGSGDILESLLWLGVYALILIANFWWFFLILATIGVILIKIVPRRQRVGRRWRFIGIAHTASIALLFMSALEHIFNLGT